jgi:hypothetical protein
MVIIILFLLSSCSALVSKKPIGNNSFPCMAYNVRIIGGFTESAENALYKVEKETCPQGYKEIEKEYKSHDRIEATIECECGYSNKINK